MMCRNCSDSERRGRGLGGGAGGGECKSGNGKLMGLLGAAWNQLGLQAMARRGRRGRARGAGGDWGESRAVGSK